MPAPEDLHSIKTDKDSTSTAFVFFSFQFSSCHSVASTSGAQHFQEQWGSSDPWVPMGSSRAKVWKHLQSVPQNKVPLSSVTTPKAGSTFPCREVKFITGCAKSFIGTSLYQSEVTLLGGHSKM